MKNILLLFTLLSVGFSSFSQEKKKIEADKKSSYITYAMKHPMHDWDAKSNMAKSVIVYNSTSQKIEAVAVVVPVKSFDSGNSNRDSHAIEVLEALKFPNVSFSASSIQESDSQVTAKGNLTFHGVSKPVELKATKSVIKNALKLEGGFTINMKDFAVEPPGLMGIKTDDKITIKYSMVFPL